MIGILYFLAFIFLGLAASNRIFHSQPIYIRGWIGILFGLINLMWLPVPFSFILGFNNTSHILAVTLNILIYLTIRYSFKTEGSFKNLRDEISNSLYFTIIPIFLLIAFVLNGHVLATGDGRGLFSGQSTYGDLPMHLGMITSLATQGTFPPEYSIFSGHLLSYPFLTNLLSASMYLLGTSLRLSVLIPSYFMIITLIAGIFILTYEVLKNRSASIISTILFFLNGGLGFFYFIDGTKSNPFNFLRIFTEWYKTPTNLNENGIRWSNTICDMIIPQRTTLAGWTVVILAIWLLFKALSENNRLYFIISGIVAGLLPMIHTHSYLALGMISLTWLFVYLFQQKDIKSYLLNWVYFGVIALVLSLPQLIFWTFRQATGQGFLEGQFGWGAIEHDNWLWFWIKNIGVIFILLIPGLLWLNKRLFSFYSGAITIFIVANLINFQPNNYDNNKLFYIWYLLSLIIVCGYAQFLYNQLNKVRGRVIYLIIFIFLCTFSGALTIGREIASDEKFMLFSNEDISISEFIKANTPKDALFISSDEHLNPISVLAGRNLLSGAPLYLAFHGINYSQRESDIKLMYTSPSDFFTLANKYKIDYVLLSSWEKNNFKIDSSFFEKNLQSIVKSDSIQIFAVSSRAKAMIGIHN